MGVSGKLHDVLTKGFAFPLGETVNLAGTLLARFRFVFLFCFFLAASPACGVCE